MAATHIGSTHNHGLAHTAADGQLDNDLLLPELLPVADGVLPVVDSICPPLTKALLL